MDTTLRVEGMSCGACVNHVTRALRSVAGVQGTMVNLQAASAVVQHDDTTDPTAFIEAVAEAGYQAHRVLNEG
jgi:copper chaperone CopZ